MLFRLALFVFDLPCLPMLDCLDNPRLVCHVFPSSCYLPDCLRTREMVGTLGGPSIGCEAFESFAIFFVSQYASCSIRSRLCTVGRCHYAVGRCCMCLISKYHSCALSCVGRSHTVLLHTSSLPVTGDIAPFLACC